MSVATPIQNLRTSLAAVKQTADAAYSSSNPPPPGAAVAITASFTSLVDDAKTALTAGKLVPFRSSDGSGDINIADSFFQTSTDGTTFRIYNANDFGATGALTINDGLADIAVIAPKEVVRLQFSTALGAWVKINGL